MCVTNLSVYHISIYISIYTYKSNRKCNTLITIPSTANMAIFKPRKTSQHNIQKRRRWPPTTSEVIKNVEIIIVYIIIIAIAIIIIIIIL